ncbi:MAG: GNAT family N-acetyltransferase [Ignavibacteria bacterium]|nr:GNAT family N-acetyltransferase [Ignavibacteria bacterium]
MDYRALESLINVRDIIIRTYNDADQISALTELLHRAYKELADMGLLYLASYQSDSVTRSRISEGITFLALHAQAIIGTITLYSQIGDCEFYQKEGVWHFGQFGVDPSYRRLGIGGKLIGTVEQYAVKHGARVISLDTAKPALHLIKHYKKYGYSIVDEVQWNEANYKSVIMAKSLLLSDDRMEIARS